MTSDALRAVLDADFPAAQRGEHDAFGRLVQATQRMVSSVALAVTRDVSVSDDIAQEAFLIAWQRIGVMRHPDSFLPWLRQVARNKAIDHVRRARYQEVAVDASDRRMTAIIDAGVGPEETVGREEERALLARALDEIPDASREVLLLFYREGQSSRNVATLLGLSDAAVRKRLQRARESLQAELLAAVAAAAERSSPGVAFTAAVASALAVGPGTASAGGVVATSSAGKWLMVGLGSAFAACMLMLAAVAWEVRGYLRQARTPAEHRALLLHGTAYAALMISFVLVLVWSKAAHWSFSTTLLVSFCYSLAIVLFAVQRTRVTRRHRPL